MATISWSSSGSRTDPQPQGYGSRRLGAFSFLTFMWACSITTKPFRFLKAVVQVPNFAGPFIKIILAKFPSIISAFFWVLGTLGAGNGMWLLSLNFTYRGMKGTFQPCHPTLNSPLQGSQTGTSFLTPAKLKQNSGGNRHRTTTYPKRPVHSGSPFPPTIVTPWAANWKR